MRGEGWWEGTDWVSLTINRMGYEQRPEAVQAWLDEQYPKIEKLAATEHMVKFDVVPCRLLISKSFRRKSACPTGENLGDTSCPIREIGQPSGHH